MNIIKKYLHKNIYKFIYIHEYINEYNKEIQEYICGHTVPCERKEEEEDNH